jgi:uncharacterized protein
VRERLHAFVQALRACGVGVSLAEAMDGARAVAAAGIERTTLREALAATLVKDEADRETFDVLFDQMFPAIGAAGEEAGRRRTRRRAARGAADAGGGRGAVMPGAGGGRSGSPPARRTGRHEPQPEGERDDHRAAERRHERAHTARRRALLALPFHAFTARDVAEARDLVRDLGRRLRGRLARRLRRAARGRLDFRRTIRGALATGGTPVRPAWRARRPGRPDLVALCDLSGSVAAASELLLGLVAPAADHFRRVHLYAYVDHLCPVSVEDGHVAPAGRLDLHARSDFGQVLTELRACADDVLTRSTLLLILGDARNNRRPPRADLLRAIRERVQAIVWLVPEPRSRWDTGDSVLGRYAPTCDAVVECLDLGTLVEAVVRALRTSASPRIAMAGRRP